jgi:isopentenyldiphosphate isomerase
MDIVLVDEEDKVIGAKERSALAPGDIYRVAVLWITNAAGDVLLAQRAAGKKWPGTWAAAVAGTVEEGENYDTNIVKEAKEEIGLDVALGDLKRGPKYRFQDEKSNHFSQSYFYRMETPVEDLTIDKNEIVQLKWFPRIALKDMLTHAPQDFAPTAGRVLALLVKEPSALA